MPVWSFQPEKQAQREKLLCNMDVLALALFPCINN